MHKFSRFRVLVAVSILAILVLSAFGCGSSGPTAAVEGFVQAAKDKDCDKMINYIDMKAFDTGGATMSQDELSALKDEMVKACKAESAFGEVVSYKVIEEKVNGESADVTVEVTTKENGEEKTETDTLKLNNRDGEWKISTM